MAFLEDPRLRQRWNRIAHDAEAVTENAAAGIWSFQQYYVNPCLGSLLASLEQCTTVCLGDVEERRRRRRERDHAQAEITFDFYDDWYEEEAQSGGLLGGWGGEDWDRLLAGTGSQRRHTGGETSEQPRRKRGMSYGTRGVRRKPSGDDPTIIPSTQPIGFLSKLPWRMGGTLRYKPSAANLQEHPGKHENAEAEPLLGGHSPPDMDEVVAPRQRSGTVGSGDTSDSYRSRGDLFPSDGEGEEDAVPLDDEVTYDMVRKDDRSSGKTRSSKGKRPAFGMSRTVSRTTIGSHGSRESLRVARASSGSLSATPDIDNVPSMVDLHMEEERLRQEEDEKISKQKEAAAQLAAARGLKMASTELPSPSEPKPDVADDEIYEPEQQPAQEDQPNQPGHSESDPARPRTGTSGSNNSTASAKNDEFVPARLPRFG
ncbi:hypothetical protein ACO1O0_008681 [Amphichorda felina]